MLRQSKKILSCYLLVLLVFSALTINVNASTYVVNEEQVIVEPRFTYINVFQNTFDISDSGKTSVSSYLTAYNVDEVRVTGYLQQYKDGKWQAIKSWSSIRDGTSNGLAKDWYVVSGYSYRYISYGYTYNDGILVESTSYVSNSKYY